MRAKDELGRRGEEMAAAYLAGAGQRVIDRNWRSPDGELDLITVDGASIVVSEVKTRRSTDYGHPFEAITNAKVRRLQSLGHQWLRDHGLAGTAMRVDAVAVLYGQARWPVIEYLKDVG